MSFNTSAILQKEREQEYEQLAKKHRPKPRVLINCLKACMVGGLICLLGQGLMLMYVKVFGFKTEKAGEPAIATLIFISCFLTGLGVYDRIGQWAGAGTAVPVTGVANAIASAALEHQAEGRVLGIRGNIFK